MDAVVEHLVDIFYLLRQAGEGLQLACDGRDHLGVDALSDGILLREPGLAVEAGISDEEDRLAALEMDRDWACVEDRKGQLSTIAWIDMET
jgi:hypothetical protein